MFTTRKWAEVPDTKKNLWAFPVHCQNCGIRLLGAAKQICRYCILSELARIYPEPKKYGELMLERPLLVPVPLSQQRRDSRGYNQSYSIAEGWVAAIPLPILREGSIARTASRINQVHVNKSERRLNMEGVYRLACPSVYDWINRPILITDDVYTTGSTCFALWQFLKSLGFKKTYLFTLAMA